MVKFSEYTVYPKEPAWKIYTRDGCSACSNAKKALHERLYSYKMIESPNSKEEKQKLIDSLKGEVSGQETFPFVFHKSKEGEPYSFIGGWSNLKDYLTKH
jgi:glutaredoxin